jgi:tetratricopeptide (TPR) repeat protein
MTDPITGIMLYLADIFFQEFVITNLDARLKDTLLKQSISNLITETLKGAISDIPGFQNEIETGSFINFLSDPFVLNEIKKIISTQSDEPDISKLCEEWAKINPGVKGNRRVLLEIFLSRLKKGLWKIPELQETLFRKDTLDANVMTRTFLPKISAQLTTLSEQTSTYQTKSAEETRLSGQLDSCKNLFSSNHPVAALNLLQGIESEIDGKNVPSELRYRLNSLIGSCEYSLGNQKEAIKRFQTALKFMPNDPKSLANASLAALLNGDYESAISLADQSLTLGGDDTVAIATKIQALAHQSNYQNLDKLIDKRYFGNCDYVRALAYIFERKNDFASAEEFYKMAIAQNVSDYHSLMGLAQTILEKNLRKFTITLEAALDVGKYIDLALEIAQKGDNPSLKLDALAAKGGLALTVGNYSEALEYCDRVLKELPTHKLALHNRAMLAMAQNDYPAALKLFEKLPEEYRMSSVALPISDVLIAAGKSDEALDILYKYRKIGANPNADVFIAKALIAQNRSADAEKIKQSLLTDKTNVEYVLAAAEIADLQGAHSDAITILENLYSELSGDNPKKIFIAIRTGLMHYFHHDFEKASVWLETITENVLKDIDLSRIYIRALYSAKKYDVAYKTLQSLRTSGINTAEFLEVEAWLAEYFGNLKSALEIQTRLAELDPNNLIHKIQLARLEFCLGESLEAEKILDAVNWDNIQSPYELMQVAEMFYWLSKPDLSIKIAYRARSLGINLPEIHLGYISLFMKIDDQLTDFLAREKITQDSAVLLKSDKGDLWIKLVTLVKPDEGKWEFSETSGIGKILLGHKAEEKVEFSSTPLERIEYTIAEIQSIYVRAFQESFDEFGTRFPQRHDIQKVSVNNENDISKLIMGTYGYSSLAELTYKAYEQGALSISQFANLISHNLIDVFTSILTTKNQRIFASFGTPEDQQRQIETAATSNSITLDITSLITSAYLESFDVLSERFKNIFISPATLTMLEQIIAERYFDLRKGKRSIGFHDGRPFFDEIPAYAIEQNLNFLKILRSFAKTRCEAVQIPADLTSYLMMPNDPLQIISKDSITTILVAKHTNTPLYSDDARLRAYAEKEFATFGFWSQSFLINCLAQNIITDTQYRESCIKLLHANYHFVSISAELIIETIRSTAYTQNSKVLAILSSLKGPDATEDTVIDIGGKVLKDIWLSAAPLEQRIFLNDLILQNICTGRNKQVVINKLLKVLDKLLIVAQAHHDPVLKHVQNWYKISSK